jgi:hypothetical protein
MPRRGRFFLCEVNCEELSVARGKFFTRVSEFKNQNLAARVEGAAGGGIGFLHGIFGKEVRDFDDETGAGQRFLHVVAFEVDVGIDLVGNAIVALIAFEADIVSGRAYP